MSDEKLEKFFPARPPTFYLPGDPRSTNYEEQLWRLVWSVASLPAHQRPTQVFFSAANYAAIVAEFRAKYEWKGNPPWLEMAQSKNSPKLRFLNAGTDDQAEVNRLNRETPGAIDFRDRLRQFEVSGNA